MAERVPDGTLNISLIASIARFEVGVHRGAVRRVIADPIRRSAAVSAKIVQKTRATGIVSVLFGVSDYDIVDSESRHDPSEKALLRVTESRLFRVLSIGNAVLLRLLAFSTMDGRCSRRSGSKSSQEAERENLTELHFV